MVIIHNIHAADWHYEELDGLGPSDWYKHDGWELCGADKQSPIAIDPSKSEFKGECKTPLTWNVPDTVYNFTINHEGEAGHTILLRNEDAANDITLENPFHKEGNTQHSIYNMFSFHFHWGIAAENGSEHVYRGTTTTFEVHFVHWSNDFAHIGDAVGSFWNMSASTNPKRNDPLILAVVGILYEEVDTEDESEYNVKADEIIRNMAIGAHMDELWQDAIGLTYTSFAITDLVDVESFEQNYYHYEGSFTTPPCWPAVRYYLAQEAIPIRKSTMDLFRIETKKWNVKSATSNVTIDAKQNFRPVQNSTSCVYSCAGDDSMTWCPEEDDSATNLSILVAFNMIIFMTILNF